MFPITPPRPAPSPARRAPQPAQAPRAAAAPAARPPAMVEADVSLRLDAQGEAGANGTVRLDQGFVKRLVKHLLRNPERFRAIDVRFDAKTGAYAATGKVKLLGLWLPVTGRATPTSDAGRPAFRLDDLAIRWGPANRWSFSPGWLGRKITELVAGEMSKSGVDAEADRRRGVVRLDPNALLHKIRALPGWVSIDTAATQFAVRTERNGDVLVTLASEAQGPRLRQTPLSDIAIAADDQALQALLFRAIAPGYLVRGVRLREGGMSVDGEAEYKPISDVANGLKVLAVVLSGGRGGNTRPVKVMGPLDLEVGIRGTVLDIKPSLRKALPEIVKTLSAAGIPHTVSKDSLQADLGPWLASRGLRVSDVLTREGLLEAHLAIDIESRIRNPALRGA